MQVNDENSQGRQTMYKKLDVSSEIVVNHMLLFGRIIFQGYKKQQGYIKYCCKTFFNKVDLNILPKVYQKVVICTTIVSMPFIIQGVELEHNICIYWMYIMC